MIFPSDRRILFKKFSPTRIETNSFGISKKRENKQKLNSFSKDARDIFFPSPYIWRGHPFKKLNCIRRIYRFLILHFDLRLDHQHTFRPFSFQFKTIPNRVSHEPLRNGAEIAFHDSVPAVDFRFSTVKHGYNALCVPCLVPRSIRYRFTAPRFARLSICAHTASVFRQREKRGEKLRNGRIYEVALVTLGKSRQFPLQERPTPPSLISAVNGLTNASTYPSAFPRFNACERWISKRGREGEFGCKLETSAPPWIRYIFPIDERVRRAC